MIKQNKTIRHEVRFTPSDSEALRRLCPNNVSYVIRQAVKFYLQNHRV